MSNQTNNKKRIEVSLLGQRFTVRSEKTEEYIQAVAKYVSGQLESLSKQTRSISTNQVALLTSLNLADQLMQKEEELHRLKTELKERTQAALKEVDDALSLLPHHHVEVAHPIPNSNDLQIETLHISPSKNDFN